MKVICTGPFVSFILTLTNILQLDIFILISPPIGGGVTKELIAYEKPGRTRSAQDN
jgi:hypothetical protein